GRAAPPGTVSMPERAIRFQALPGLSPGKRYDGVLDLRQVDRLEGDAAALGDAEEGLGSAVAEGDLDLGRDAVADRDGSIRGDQHAAAPGAEAAARARSSTESAAAGAGQIEGGAAIQRIDDVRA